MTWLIMLIQIPVIAFVYAGILTKPGHLLGSLYARVTEFVQLHPQYEFYLQPVILCPLCVSGQMALWSAVFYLLGATWVPVALNALFFLSFPILIVFLLNKLHD